MEFPELAELQLESQGGFTLDLQRALVEWGQTPHRHGWLLFLVQTFVLAGSRQLTLHVRRDELWAVAWLDAPVALVESGRTEWLFGSEPLARAWSRCLAGLLRLEPQRLIHCRWENAKTPGLFIDLLDDGSPWRPALPPPLAAQGACQGLYLRLPARDMPNVEAWLAYAVQYCPIPVHWSRRGLMARSDDLRGKHWLEDTTSSPIYPVGTQIQADTPLLCEFYSPQLERGGLLLKPAGGSDHALRAEWTDQPLLPWHRKPHPLDSTSALARYTGGCGATQELSWLASGGWANTALRNRQQSRDSQPFPLGNRLMILLQDEKAGDWIVPVQGGVCLWAVRNRLKIPGVGVIACADGLDCDLSAMQLREEALEGWLAELRGELAHHLENALANPPLPGSEAGSKLWKSMLTVGLAGLAFGVSDGLQLWDIFWFTHAGLAGGTLLHAGKQALSRLFPERLGKGAQRRLEQRLQNTLRACRENA